MFLVKARSEPSHMQHSGFFTFFVSWAVPAFLLLLAYIKRPDGRHVLHFLAKSTDDWKCVTVLQISNSAVLLSDGTNVLPVHYRSWPYTLNHHKNVKKKTLYSHFIIKSCQILAHLDDRSVCIDEPSLWNSDTDLIYGYGHNSANPIPLTNPKN